VGAGLRAAATRRIDCRVAAHHCRGLATPGRSACRTPSPCAV